MTLRTWAAPGNGRAVRSGVGSVLFGFILFAAVAEAGSPAATPTPDVPSPRLCTVQARAYDEIVGLLSTPMADASPTRTPGPVPSGPPADAETVAAVTATTRALVACFNAGEPLRAYSLYTDSYLQRLLDRQGPPPRAVYDAFATPQPAPDDERDELVAIRDVVQLEHGLVGATVTIRYAVVPMPKTFFFTYARIGDRWLIDGILGEISFSVP